MSNMSPPLINPQHAPSIPAPSVQAAPRPRQQGRKKAAPPIEPDSLYRASSVSAPQAVAGAKRSVQERGDGEPRKRKRVDHHVAASHASTHANGSGSAAVSIGGMNPYPASAKQSVNPSASGRAGPGSSAAAAGVNSNAGLAPDAEGQPSLFEFSTLPTSALYQYIIQYDLVPVIYPTPLTADDPPPPIALLDPARMASRAPTPAPLIPVSTPANRPRRSRETKEASRRRSTRLLEEELRGGMEQVPVLADIAELHNVLATIAQRHFRESSVREVDTLASFMGAVKTRR